MPMPLREPAGRALLKALKRAKRAQSLVVTISIITIIIAVKDLHRRGSETCPSSTTGFVAFLSSEHGEAGECIGWWRFTTITGHSVFSRKNVVTCLSCCGCAHNNKMVPRVPSSFPPLCTTTAMAACELCFSFVGWNVLVFEKVNRQTRSTSTLLSCNQPL